MAGSGSRLASPVSFFAMLLVLILGSRAHASGATSVPGAPAITSVTAKPLGLLVAWAPADASEEVSSYSLTATASTVPGVLVPNECDPPPATIAPSTDSAVIMGGLCEGIPYRVTVTATNSLGAGPPSEASNAVAPLPASAPSAPQIIATIGRDSELRVGWVPPADGGGSPITEYRLTATLGRQIVTVITPGDATSATIPGLKNNRTYALALVASNAVGDSPAGPGSGKPRRASKPAEPSGVTAVAAGAGALAVSWTPPEDDGGSAITGYQVFVQRLEKQTDRRTRELRWKPRGPKLRRDAGASPVEIAGLEPTERYQVTIRARNARGRGPTNLPVGPVKPSLVLQPNAIQLSAAAMAAIASLDGGVLTIPTPVPSEFAALEVGQVLVGSASAATPGGLLARIVSIDASGGPLVVATEPATLTEAFSSLSLSAIVAPEELADSSPVAGVAGVRTLSKPRAGNDADFSLGSHTVRIELKDGGNEGTSFTGQVTLKPNLSIAIDLDHAGLAPDLYVWAYASVNVKGDLSLAAFRDFKLPPNLDSAPALFTFPSPAIPVGPVMICPRIPVKAQLDATAKLGARAVFDVTPYASGWWHSLQGADGDNPLNLHLNYGVRRNSVAERPVPNVVAEATGRAALVVSPRLLVGACPANLTVPDLAAGLGVGLELRGGAKAKIDPNAGAGEPWFKIGPFLALRAFFSFEFPTLKKQIGATIEEFDLPPSLYEIKGSPPAPPAVFPGTAKVEVGETRQFAAISSGGAVTWRILGGTTGDTIDSSGLLSVTGPPYRTLIVEASNTHGEDTSFVAVTDGNGRRSLDPPGDLAANRLDPTTAEVSWTPPTYTGATPISTYTLVISPSTRVQRTPGDATTTTVTGLDQDTGYVVLIQATTVDGFQTPSASVYVPRWSTSIEPTPTPNETPAPTPVPTGGSNCTPGAVSPDGWHCCSVNAGELCGGEFFNPVADQCEFASFYCEGGYAPGRCPAPLCGFPHCVTPEITLFFITPQPSLPDLCD